METLDNRVMFEHKAVERVGTLTKADVGTLSRTHGSCKYYQYFLQLYIEIAASDRAFWGLSEDISQCQILRSRLLPTQTESQ